MEHSLSGARYSIILFMWPPLHLSPANGRLMEKPPEGGGPMESAEDMLCRLFAFLRKQTRRLILLSSPPSDYGSARHPYAEEPGVLEAWNALLRTLAGKLNLPFIDFCGDMLQYRPLPDSGEEDFPEAYRNLGKQVLHRLPFGQTWVRRRSGKYTACWRKEENAGRNACLPAGGHWRPLPITVRKPTGLRPFIQKKGRRAYCSLAVPSCGICGGPLPQNFRKTLICSPPR